MSSSTSSSRNSFRRFCDWLLHSVSQSKERHSQRTRSQASRLRSPVHTVSPFPPVPVIVAQHAATYSPYTASYHPSRSSTPSSTNSHEPRMHARVAPADPQFYMASFTSGDFEPRIAGRRPSPNPYQQPNTNRLYPSPPETSPNGSLAPSHRSIDYRIADDLAGLGRGTLVYNCTTGVCVRRMSPASPRLHSTRVLDLRAPATHPPTRALRVVSRALPWRVEVYGMPYVSVGAVLARVREEAALPVNEPEFNLVSPRRRTRMRDTYARRATEATAIDEPIARADILGAVCFLGGLRSDDAFFQEFHNIAQPRPGDMPTFVMDLVTEDEALRRVGLDRAFVFPS